MQGLGMQRVQGCRIQRCRGSESAEGAEAQGLGLQGVQRVKGLGLRTHECKGSESVVEQRCRGYTGARFTGTGDAESAGVQGS